MLMLDIGDAFRLSDKQVILMQGEMSTITAVWLTLCVVEHTEAISVMMAKELAFNDRMMLLN